MKSFLKNKSKDIQGFTIVETLVAITILMIAIAGPLVIASKGLMASLHARDQMIASYLAQETMEFIKNKRDNNMFNDPNPMNWLTDISDCASDNHCDASALSNSVVKPCEGYDGGCQVYLTDYGYTTADSGASTAFTRYFYFETPTGDAIDSNTKEVRAVVEVQWYQGTVSNTTKLRSQLTRSYR